MEQVARMNLPIVGRVQHGEKQIVDNKTKVKELGYFIAKIRNDNMNFLLNKFNGKVNTKLIKKLKIKLMKNFNIDLVKYQT